MKNILQSAFLLLIFQLMGSIGAQAQLINFEETWQAFLKDPLTASVSELPKPPKSSVGDYAKYHLMYANSSFCADELIDAESYLKELKSMDKSQYDKYPGFSQRLADLEEKMKAYYKVDVLWKRHLQKFNVSRGELEAAEEGRKVCEKGTLAKYYQMMSMAYYCEGNEVEALNQFENKAMRIVDKTSLQAADVEGLPGEIKRSKAHFKVLGQLNKAWKTYMDSDVSPGFEPEVPLYTCYTIPNMKAYMLRAMVDVCKNGSEMLAKIKALEAENTHDIPADLAEKIGWLEAEVKKYNGNLAVLNKAWGQFTSSGKVDPSLKYMGEYCEKDAQIKAYTMAGTLDYCNIGEEMLGKIAAVQKEYNPTLDATTKAKIKALEKLVTEDAARQAKLEEAWAEFVPQDTLNSIDFAFEYCDKEAQIRAYIMDGRVNACYKGEQRLADIDKLMASAKPSLQADTKAKWDDLKVVVAKYRGDIAALDKLWASFIQNNDTIYEEFTVEPYYCDKITQVKSWCLVGNVNTCEQGQEYMDKIDSYTKTYKLKYDRELSCRITRLRQQIWDCRYWELVRQAQRETHEERERFGPESAEMMRLDLNNDKLPCNTEVLYEPLGKIGVRYVIQTFLCQGTDLAKMGDPEYYKKIATWVDTEVLSKYCEANMRCKKDFYIYLEGHTDGHPFSFHRYKKSLGVPKGTEFTHFVGKGEKEAADTIVKKTERELSFDLKSNMELGIARAWTVREQLQFMKVPITIGAYEHPSKERGAEYRRVDVELNITNLLLDFYEKRLAELIEESGIGEKPKDCKG